MRSHRTPMLAAAIGLLSLWGCATFKYVPQEQQIPRAAYAIEDGEVIVVDLARVPVLQTVGQAATIVDERLSRHLLIAHPAADEYVVVAAHCTHRDRALSYQHETGQFRCSSLGHSTFALDGTPTGGPAKKPLQVFRASVEAGQLRIQLGRVGAPPPRW